MTDELVQWSDDDLIEHLLKFLTQQREQKVGVTDHNSMEHNVVHELAGRLMQYRREVEDAEITLDALEGEIWADA